MSTEIDFREVVYALGDGVIACDKGGKIIVWNGAATRIFGFTEEEALGQSLDLIVPERQRQRHWEGYDKTMETGVTRYGNDVLRVPALHKDNKPLSIAFTVSMLRSPEGEVTAIIAAVRDETERWSEERKLRARVTQLEAG